MSTLRCLPPTGISTNISSWLLWGIWTTRNLLLFENRGLAGRETMGKAIPAAREWLLAQSKPAPTSQLPHSPTDLPTITHDLCLCNTDAAWTVDRKAGLGWHFENPAMAYLAEGSRVIAHVSSPLMAEALVMREALQEAKRKSLSNVWFRTDSQELARAINSKIYPVELFGVLMDIELLSSSLAFFFVSFVSRENNTVADSLAKYALHFSSVALY
ncbi:hypothetical protein Bca4012_009940 [Brassica carinata]